jgi:hypothetical protein
VQRSSPVTLYLTVIGDLGFPGSRLGGGSPNRRSFYLGSNLRALKRRRGCV